MLADLATVRNECAKRTVLVRVLSLVPVLFAALSLSGCFSYYTWHEKLTLVVETPTGVVTGSSVVKINARYGQQPLSPIEVNYRMSGEATVVEVAPGRYLFALIEFDRGERYYWANFEKYRGQRRRDWLKLIPKAKEVAILDPDSPYPSNGTTYPTLVTFRNIDDPKSVREVDPRNLAATFGSGYKLLKATLEITNEPMTRGRVVPLLSAWLSQAEGDKLPQALRLPDESPRGWKNLSAMSFFWGIDWKKE